MKVLITLKHLLVIVLLVPGGMLAGIAAAWSAGLDESMAPVGAAVFVILVPGLLGWPVFRLLSLRPLILPLCPHCGKRCCNYHVPRDAWPDAVIVCCHCYKPVRLILSTRGLSVTPSSLPSLTLRRPGFLGLWKHGGGK